MLHDYLMMFIGGVIALALRGALFDRSKIEKDFAVRWVVERSPAGLYARDICKLTGLAYSGIYIRLAELVDRGVIKCTRDQHWPHRFKYYDKTGAQP